MGYMSGMLTKCANPICLKEFRSLRSGRLFVIDAGTEQFADDATARVRRRSRKLEYAWLCDNCCKTMKVAVDANHCVVVISTVNAGATSEEGPHRVSKLLFQP